MLVLVDTNESTDREINRKDRAEREDSANLRAIARLREHFPNLQETDLDCGDVVVLLDNGKRLAIERKRAGDFLGSIASKRIFKQVENMANKADWGCVVIEGVISFDRDDMAVIPVYNKSDNYLEEEVTNWRGVSVRGAMYAIQFSGCPIIFAQPKSFPHIVEDLAKFCLKPSEHYQQLGKHRYVTFPPLSITEEIVASFPGVGLKRAKKLVEHSVTNNENGVATLAEVLAWGAYLDKVGQKSRPEGWGNMTITNFRATLGLESGEYLDIKEDKSQKKGKKNGK